ncbi:MAG: single-stranded DNA-binding protein [Bacteroidales bacterium]|nr:single-stranded DNA-binding protein [Bacteroidales bacterium]
MLKSEIIGNLGSDAQVKEINGKEYVSFNIAHTDRKGETIWMSVLWRGNGGNLTQWLTKGTSLFVRGDLDFRIYTNNRGEQRISYSLMANEVQLLSSTRGQEERGYVNSAREMAANAAPAATAAVDNPDDDLPF